MELYQTANKELVIISKWFKANKLTLTTSKTKHILFRKHDANVNIRNI